MTEGRGLLTETEREAIAGERSDSYRYKTRAYFRNRLEEVEKDVEVLNEHAPELLEDLQATVCDRPVPAAESSAHEHRETPTEPPDDLPPAEDTRRDSEPAAPLEGIGFPSGQDRADCVATILSVRDYLRESGPASMREIVTDVMPEHSLGYDVPELEAGDRYRGAWWRNIVKPGLIELDDVEHRKNHGDYRYVGEPEA